MVDPQHDEAVVLAYHTALSKLLRVFSGLALASAIVYVLGWLRLSGYYISFNAEWILSGVTFTELVFHGIWPFSALLLGLLWSFTDIANRLVGRDLNKIILYTLVLTAAGLGLSLVFGAFGDLRAAALAANSALLASASVSMAQFGEVVLELDRNGFRLRSKQIRNLCGALFSFGLMTSSLGVIEGQRDKTDSTSTLPRVIAGPPTGDWRLLVIRGDLSYLANLSLDQASIAVMKTEKIRMIIPHARKQ